MSTRPRSPSLKTCAFPKGTQPAWKAARSRPWPSRSGAGGSGSPPIRRTWPSWINLPNLPASNTSRLRHCCPACTCSCSRSRGYGGIFQPCRPRPATSRKPHPTRFFAPSATVRSGAPANDTLRAGGQCFARPAFGQRGGQSPREPEILDNWLRVPARRSRPPLLSVMPPCEPNEHLPQASGLLPRRGGREDHRTAQEIGFPPLSVVFPTLNRSSSCEQSLQAQPDRV